MPDSSGSSPASRPSLRLKAGWRPIWLVVAWCWLVTGAAAAMPDYLRTALNHFTPNVPAGWAYTLATTRNEQQMVERFDPARPPDGQWSLRQFQGRNPTTEELEKYTQSRPSTDSGGMQANFQKNDIEPGSLKLLREDETRAEFQATFREESGGADKMLGHLQLKLTVNKQLAYVERYVLELKEPYWPVLTVKMNTLRIEATFSVPTDTQPSLLTGVESHFAGRILLISNEENLQLIYSEFSPRP
jgi:hypothetical protein